jgi:hypothetical protein
MPGVVVLAEQLTAGGDGITNAPKSMCCASLHTFTSVPDPLHAYCAGAKPLGNGP